MKILGIVLVVIGLVGVIWGGVSWTTREKVLDIGPVEVTTEDQERLPIPPIVGAIVLVAGVVILLKGRGRAVV